MTGVQTCAFPISGDHRDLHSFPTRALPISLAPGCTYTLTAAASSGPLGPNGLPRVTTRITIAGAQSTITRSSSQQFRILEVDGPGGNLSASALTITGGNANQPGGGVFNNAGTLTLNSSAVTGNTTSEDAGGILNKAGTAVLNASRVDHNTSASGGGIASGSGNMVSPEVTDSSLILNGSRVDHNEAAEGGPDAPAGGIVNGGTAVLRGSTVDDNSAPGGAGAGIFNHGTMTITGSQITGNTAPTDSAGNTGMVGGVANVFFGYPGSGVLTMNGSTISGNSASGFAGGLGNAPDSTATITGSSVSGNSTDGPGGGVINQGELAMTGSRVLDNTAAAGGGIANQDGTVTLTSTRVAGNTPDNCEPPGAIAGCTG